MAREGAGGAAREDCDSARAEAISTVQRADSEGIIRAPRRGLDKTDQNTRKSAAAGRDTGTGDG